MILPIGQYPWTRGALPGSRRLRCPSSAGSPLTELLSDPHGLLAAGVAYLDTVEAEGDISDATIEVY